MLITVLSRDIIMDSSLTFAILVDSIPLKLCLYLVPFLRYSMSNNGVTLKSELRIIQGHWKWHQSTDRIRVPIYTSLFTIYGSTTEKN